MPTNFKTIIKICLVDLGFFCVILFNKTVTAQIVPDKTLPQNSLVTVSDNTIEITGGTRAGNNLYHSFQQFSTSTGSSTLFNNALDIQNIISRVTGKSISNIDGLIKANGTANLFLINPNGIIFGKDARLDIGGSFIASTATSLKFPNNLDFSATNPENIPLLSINTPIGLQYGTDPGAIQVKGDGQGTRKTNQLIDTTNTLRVQPNKTLALVGGDLILDGGTLKTAGGRIELGSVGSGSLIKLNSTNNGFNFTYDLAQNFKSIQLFQGASVDSSGEGQGDIQIQARQLTVQDGSQIENSTLREKSGGTLYVTTTDSIDISGTSADGQARSGLASIIYPGAKGDGGNLIVDTKQLSLREGSGIATVTQGLGKSSNLIVNASDSVLIKGFSSINPSISSTISNTIYGSGNGANLTLSTKELTIEDGASLGSAIFGTGNGGNVNVHADLIKVTGGSSLFTPSSFSNITFNRGNAGSLVIKTQKLIITNGGIISTSTTGSGNAGSLIVNASDSIDIDGILQGSPSLFRSSLSSSSTVAPSIVQQIFNLPPILSGESGQVTVNTRKLTVTNGATLSGRNDGFGGAGNLFVNAADSISLNQGTIAASTISGDGGNIFINTSYLQISENSAISTSAGNRGNGGNIAINADIISASKNSRITANAFRGRGGNITINAKGLFFSPDSLITTSSKYGINGNIQFNIVNPNIYTTEIKAKEISEVPQITSVCQREVGTKASNFIVSSSRSLQPNPDAMILNDMGQSNFAPNPQNQKTNSSTSKQPTQIIEANVLIRDEQGNLVLTTDQEKANLDNASLSANSCFSMPQ
ncbi:filamentous hemagglutinin N-terminal domain-containing protein [Nostoc flagelliforme FACHB-838]|uniref:Filamentous hemagglutinin N-terminal domain-containing protein n=1 Tax=Nostoc flagelliforme FACHB-838 TaxID=2692904 RepID=A0ABR8E147_9NOSO|nr:filamentous hemagglutinin N-terminal domain-containing protein [Nostoc flagelliforme]MBD2535457.1 filamentous hemagglutinin N-terminal domain-containing protein [Nostoc flagelliforme FACHB-838]